MVVGFEKNPVLGTDRALQLRSNVDDIPRTPHRNATVWLKVSTLKPLFQRNSAPPLHKRRELRHSERQNRLGFQIRLFVALYSALRRANDVVEVFSRLKFLLFTITTHAGVRLRTLLLRIGTVWLGNATFLHRFGGLSRASGDGALSSTTFLSRNPLHSRPHLSFGVEKRLCWRVTLSIAVAASKGQKGAFRIIVDFLGHRVAHFLLENSELQGNKRGVPQTCVVQKVHQQQLLHRGETPGLGGTDDKGTEKHVSGKFPS